MFEFLVALTLMLDPTHRPGWTCVDPAHQHREAIYLYDLRSRRNA